NREQIARVYERFAQTVNFYTRLQILPFSENAIKRYEELSRQKLGIRANDLRIAAIALDLSATIVTRNRSDFVRIPGLRIEDWSVA
ncbi:MAG TPA: type II toxin-antitoxin system VapC family toxin, partial [Pirellulales bacterium]